MSIQSFHTGRTYIWGWCGASCSVRNREELLGGSLLRCGNVHARGSRVRILDTLQTP